jgi:hypothetical protein
MRLKRIAVGGLGMLVVLVVTQMPASASTAAVVPAPEIDATSISAGLGLLAAGVMIARAYSGRK